MKTLFLLIFLSTHFSAQVLPENLDITSFAENYRQINNNGMYVLGSWALLNITAGTLAASFTKGETKHFHVGNAAWNTVNLAIAGFALLNPDTVTGTTQVIKNYSSLTGFLLFNAGLDIAYITAGFYLKERSLRSIQNGDRLKGYGNALLLQGAALLIFDTVLYFAHSKNAELHFYPLLEPASKISGLGIFIPL